MVAIERSIWINAPRDRVWHAITDPQRIQQWFSPTTPWECSELAVGGRLYVRDPDTGAEMYVQVIERMEPPAHFITRTVPEPPGIPHVTIYALAEERGGTRLTLTHTGYELAPADQRAAQVEQNAFGFGMMLENIQAHVEGTPLPYPGGF
jgi:uncharacterized protein YndB with AHSA1/START domain